MATEMISNHTDELGLSTAEVIATSTASTLAETTIHDDTANVAPQIHNTTASHNFNTTNFTATTLTRLLNESVTAEVVEGGLPSTLLSENVTFPQETTSSRLVLSSSSTFGPVISVENVQTLSPDSFNTTISSMETTLGYFNDVDVQPASTVGIAIGVAIGGFILLALIVAVIIFFVRRRRIARKKESEIVMENPRYTLTRDSVPQNFDLTMHTGPMNCSSIRDESLQQASRAVVVKLEMRNQLNNNSAESLTRTNGKRKKEAPQPPIYRPLGGKDAGSKRKAPSPPRLGEVGYDDLYEKDSVTGSTEALELTSFLKVDNCNADPIATDSKTSHAQPLLESFKPDKKSPKRSSKVDSGERPAAEDSIKQDDEDKDDDEQMKTALLGKTKADSNLSLDSYDKAKNPFFGE